jgi:flagellar basal body-associated protein FliL
MFRANEEREIPMRSRSLIVLLIVAGVIAGVAVAARGHGGFHKWVMAIHGR